MPDFPYRLKVGGKPQPLVKVLHIWLDWLGTPPPAPGKTWESLGNKYTEQTKQAIIKYQLSRGISPADGIVKAREWSELGKQIGYRVFDRKIYDCLYDNNGCSTDTFNFVQNIGGYTGNSLSGGIHVYGPMFMSMYFQEFGGIGSEVFDGLGTFLNFMRTDSNLTDIRYAAYLMSSAYHESFHTWQPIDEKGKGAGREYGKQRTGKCGGKDYKNYYYGRGYIQITWEDNYQLADRELGLGCTLVANPERAKEPEIAYKIASKGMTEGWFEKKHNYKLADFITSSTTDYFNARKIVNPNETKTFALLEGYAKTFEAMLRATMFR